MIADADDDRYPKFAKHTSIRPASGFLRKRITHLQMVPDCVPRVSYRVADSDEKTWWRRPVDMAQTDMVRG